MKNMKSVHNGREPERRTIYMHSHYYYYLISMGFHRFHNPYVFIYKQQKFQGNCQMKKISEQ